MTDPREAGDTAAWGLGTKAIHAGQAPDPTTGPSIIAPPPTASQKTPGTVAAWSTQHG